MSEQPELDTLVEGLTMEHFDDVEVHHGRCVLVSDIPIIIERLRERIAQDVGAVSSMGGGDDFVRIGVWRVAVSECASAVRGESCADS